MTRRWHDPYPWLRTAPMLAGAIVALFAGVWIMFKSTGQAVEFAIALVVLGAVLLGSWITMLAAHDYSGRNEPTLPEPEPEEEEQ